MKSNTINHLMKDNMEKILKKVGAFVLDLPEEDVTLCYFKEAHEGPGWYVWNSEYPEDGSLRLDFGLLLKS